MNLEKKLNQLKALDRFLKNKKYNFEELLNILLDKEVLFTNLNEYYELVNAIDGIYIEKNIKLYTDENLKEMVLSICSFVKFLDTFLLRTFLFEKFIRC